MWLRKVQYLILYNKTHFECIMLISLLVYRTITNQLIIVTSLPSKTALGILHFKALFTRENKNKLKKL